MDWLIGFVALILAACIVGTFFLVCSVVWYAWKEISKSEIENSCDWVSKNEIFKTKCGNHFFDATENGNPVTDWITYCPYCGNKINQK